MVMTLESQTITSKFADELIPIANDDYYSIARKLGCLIRNHEFLLNKGYQSHHQLELQGTVLKLIKETDALSRVDINCSTFFKKTEKCAHEAKQILLTTFNAIATPTKNNIEDLHRVAQHHKKTRKVFYLLMNVIGAVTIAMGIACVLAGAFGLGVLAAVAGGGLFIGSYKVKGEGARLKAGNVEAVIKSSIHRPQI